MTDQTPEYQRWTAKRKAAVVLEVLKGQTTSVDACRKYRIKQSELEEWTERSGQPSPTGDNHPDGSEAPRPRGAADGADQG